MADRSSVLQGLKSSPKGQLCYDEKMKKERIWTCISCIRVERVVEEHYSRGNKLGAAGVSAASPGALGPSSGSPRGDVREERETDLASELLGLSSTSVAEQERRSSKDGEEAAHGCSPSLCRVQPEAFYHPREVAMEQEYIRCEGDVWWREERRKQSKMTQRVEVMSEHTKQLEEDRCRELLEAVQCSRARERESRAWKQQLEEKLWVEGQSEIDARLKVYRQQQLYADDSLKTMEQEKRELYSRLWSELYSLLQTHLKAREGAVQACRDITRLVGMRAKVDHLADSLLKRVKDAWGNLTEDMHQTLLGEVHVFDGAVQELMREVVSVNIQVGKEEEGRRAAAEEQRRRQEEERERKRKEAEKPTTQHTQPPQPATPPSSVVSGSTASTGSVTNPSVLSEYNRLIERRKNAEKAAEIFVDTQDPNLKAYRFNLQKAVNTPINSISIQSAGHIKDKVQRLCSLLAGRSVEVVGKRVSVTTHPQALNYCRILLAKKIVGQGEKQVSSHFEAAFPTAAVALGVWSEHLDIGDLLLASFYLTCPILVPLPIPAPPQVTEGEYKRLLGYNVSGKVLEDDDKYMKRMSGVVRLFAAMVQCPTVIWGRRNPMGVEHGWRWFALMLNMAPLPGITATAIFDFLEVAGHALMNAYGAQFRKLLRVLISRYLPKIEAVTPPSQQGPIIRLKQFLESCIQTGSVPTPKGMLPFEFWKGR